jgi:hypothetical protein
MNHPTDSSSSLPNEESGSSEEWMRVLDRYLDGASHGALESGDSPNDFFFFEGEFHDSFATIGTQSRGGMGLAYNRDRGSSSSLLLYHSSESDNKERFKSDTVVRQRSLPDTTNTYEPDIAGKSNREDLDESDGEEDMEESELGTESVDDFKVRASRNERKRNLEKRRRSDTRSQFQILATNLRDIEQDILLMDGTDIDDPTSNDTNCNRAKTTDNQGAESAFKKGKVPNSNNRCDLISRANKALLCLQGECHKLRKDNKALRKVIAKLSAFSSTPMEKQAPDIPPNATPQYQTTAYPSVSSFPVATGSNIMPVAFVNTAAPTTASVGCNNSMDASVCTSTIILLTH